MYFNSKHQEHWGQTFTKCDIQHLVPENFTGSKPGETISHDLPFSQENSKHHWWQLILADVSFRLDLISASVFPFGFWEFRTGIFRRWCNSLQQQLQSPYQGKSASLQDSHLTETDEDISLYGHNILDQ